MKFHKKKEDIPSLFVAPLAGAWIEILDHRSSLSVTSVAPLAGAWIEINIHLLTPSFLSVAPLAGAWIEIVVMPRYGSNGPSLPSRERGLK